MNVVWCMCYTSACDLNCGALACLLLVTLYMGVGLVFGYGWHSW